MMAQGQGDLSSLFAAPVQNFQQATNQPDATVLTNMAFSALHRKY